MFFTGVQNVSEHEKNVQGNLGLRDMISNKIALSSLSQKINKTKTHDIQ